MDHYELVPILLLASALCVIGIVLARSKSGIMRALCGYIVCTSLVPVVMNGWASILNGLIGGLAVLACILCIFAYAETWTKKRRKRQRSETDASA